MQKQLLVAFFLVLSLALNAQIKGDTSRIIKKAVITTTVPVKTVVTPTVNSGNGTATQTKPQSGPATTPPAQPTLTDADYFLAGAVIKVTTGSDNKEANTSTAFFYIRPRKAGGAVAYKLADYAAELKANQSIDLRLDRATTLNTAQNSLQYFKQNGLSVVVAYCNKNFCTDAWKINGISITLEFKDVNGNPAPSGYGSKTINFPVSSGTLGFIAGCNPFWVTDGKTCMGYSDQMSKMLLKTDEYLNALPAKLLNWFADDVN
ncbi:hypothetical protein [Ferruginibacter sp.]